MPESRPPLRAKIIAFPEVRRLSWAAMSLESAYQIVLALWTGGLAAVASLAVPQLLGAIEERGAASRAALDLLGSLGLLGCGAGSFLLLVSLLMHLLAMRSTRATFLQTAFLLAMTLTAVALQVVLAPKLSDLLRLGPTLWSPGGAPLSHFQSLFALHLGLVLFQTLIGSALLLTGTRRWYRSARIDSEEAESESM